MILYNVTVGIDADVEQEWLIWMIHEHIPKVIATEMFESYEIYKVLSHDAADKHNRQQFLLMHQLLEKFALLFCSFFRGSCQDVKVPRVCELRL